MGERPVPRQKKNIIRFPSKQERERILRENEDKRVRLCVLLRMVCGWLLAAGALLFALVNYRLFLPSSIRSLAQYAAAGLQSHTGDASAIPYENGAFSDAALFGGGLAYGDGDTLYIASPGSSGAPGQALAFISPAVETAGDYVLAYERGGGKASLHNAFSQTGAVELASPIITGSLNPNGRFVLVTDEQGYRTAVAVYDARGKEVFKWNSSEYYIVSAALSPDGKTLAVLAFQQNGVTLDTHLMLYAVSRGEQTADAVLTDSLGMEVRWLTDGTAAALCDDGLYLCDRKGQAEQALTATPGDLLAFAQSEGGFVLALRSYAGNARGDLYTLRADGKLNGPFSISEDPTAVSISGAGVAVLTASGVSVYDHDFTPRWRNREGVGARRVLLTDDGTVFALYTKNARLFTAHSEQSEDIPDETDR